MICKFYQIPTQDTVDTLQVNNDLPLEQILSRREPVLQMLSRKDHHLRSTPIVPTNRKSWIVTCLVSIRGRSEIWLNLLNISHRKIPFLLYLKIHISLFLLNWTSWKIGKKNQRPKIFHELKKDLLHLKSPQNLPQ